MAVALEALPFSDSVQIGIIEAGRERIERVDALCGRLGVDALIRMHAGDFKLLDGLEREFVHFNLQATLNAAGRRYAIVPITKPGRRLLNAQEILPIIDPAAFRFCTCMEVLQYVPVEQVTAEQFARSLPTIRTVQQLRAVLIARYAHMFPDLTDDELMARGCAVTRLMFDDVRQR
jgi:hypothetical protein